MSEKFSKGLQVKRDKEGKKEAKRVGDDSSTLVASPKT